MVYNCGRSFINRYQVVDYKCKTRMNEGRNVTNYQFRTQKTEGKKHLFTYFCSVIRYFAAGLSLFSDSEMKRAEWLSSILARECDWLLVHSHNGERSRRLASRPFSQWRALATIGSRPFSQWRERSAIGRGETDDPAPGSATETGYVCSSGMWWQKINAVLDTLQRGNTSPALTNSSQEPRCKLRAIGNREKSNRYAQRGARTHDPEIKSLMLYRLS